jgi:hypothetical protein
MADDDSHNVLIRSQSDADFSDAVWRGLIVIGKVLLYVALASMAVAVLGGLVLILLDSPPTWERLKDFWTGPLTFWQALLLLILYRAWRH